MPEVKFEAVLKELKQKQYRPVYFFHGEEAFFIDKLIAEIENNALPDAQRAFNQTVLYGRDLQGKTGKLLDMAMRLPMMADRQVIVVREAQTIKDWTFLVPYLKNPNPATVLAIAHKVKKLDGRSAFAKVLKKKAVMFYSKPLRNYDIPAWMKQYTAEKGYTINDKSCEMIVEFLGAHLDKIINELDKLFITAKQKNITPAVVEDNVGISKDYNVFELQNAFMKKDTQKIFGILHYFKQNPKAGHIVFVLSTLYRFFSKMVQYYQLQPMEERFLPKSLGVNPYFVKNYVHAGQLYSKAQVQKNMALLAQYDLRSKGVKNAYTPNFELLRELSVKLLGVK